MSPIGPRRIFAIINNIISYFNLETELDDFEKIHSNIQRDIIFKGTNLWILVFAIVVASVGLNMNSTAVIIGAMLISPLMGPINGMGYSLATYNFVLFKNAFKNFGFAVATSLIASSLYFAVSPISTAHSELLARTSPTIYDVLIALFGGLAGIVAISSKQKGNVIPGVAIATALMPPLCTAGYGLATLQFNYFFGALYLFTINAVFIGLSSVLISQILKFPIRTVVEPRQKKKIKQIMWVVTTLVILPSIFFGYKLVVKERFIEKAGKYVNNISIFEGNYLLRHDILPDSRTLVLTFGGANFSDHQRDIIREKASDFGLENINIEFRQGLSFDALTSKNTELESLRIELSNMSLLLGEKDRLLEEETARTLIGKELLDEIRPLFPAINGCYYSKSRFYNAPSTVSEGVSVVVFRVAEKDDDGLDRIKLEAWLKQRLKTQNLKMFIEVQKPRASK
jgi:uncharacterized hydrophobic protein (TIGR00271 family)